MSHERIFKILITDYTSESLKLEEELERLINVSIDTDVKISKIKEVLAKIASVDSSIAKLTSMFKITNNNTKEI